MYSRIYQISTTPIDKDDYIEESRYFDSWFISSIADYVDGYTNREDDIEWLKSCYKDNGLSFGVDDGGEYLIIEDKSKYFGKRFEEFQKTIKELYKGTLDDFSNGKLGRQMYDLKSKYEDKFGFYVDIGKDYDELYTFDGFVRLCKEGAKFYIGATIDYHF